jgi:hypothetical protein
VVDERIGGAATAQLVAVGRESARVRTTLMLAPLDDVVLRIDAIELYGKVSECAVTDDGVCLLTLVYNAVAGDSLAHLVTDGGGRTRESSHGPARVRRTDRAHAGS